MQRATIFGVLGFVLAGCVTGDPGSGTEDKADVNGKSPVFASNEQIRATLSAPWATIRSTIHLSEDDPSAWVPATLSYVDGNGQTVTLSLEARVRGFFTRDCTYPKLKLKFLEDAAYKASIFVGSRKIKLATHCMEDARAIGDFGEGSTPKGPIREAFAYRLLEMLEIPTLETRPAIVTYVDTSPEGSAATIVRSAFLLEDLSTAEKRYRAREMDEMGFDGPGFPDFAAPAKTFSGFDSEQVARVLFAEAMLGNDDFILLMQEGGRSVGGPGGFIGNLHGFERADGTRFLLANDFNFSSFVARVGLAVATGVTERVMTDTKMRELLLGYSNASTSQFHSGSTRLDAKVVEATIGHFQGKQEQALDALERTDLRYIDPATESLVDDSLGRTNIEEHIRSFFANMDFAKVASSPDGGN